MVYTRLHDHTLRPRKLSPKNLVAQSIVDVSSPINARRGRIRHIVFQMACVMHRDRFDHDQGDECDRGGAGFIIMQRG